MPDRPPIVAVTRPLPGGIEIEGADVRVWRGAAPSRDVLLGFVGGATAAVTWVTERVDEAFLDAAGDNLRVVSNFAVGFDNIDTDACRERGVIVTNTPDAVTEGTANLAIGLMLAAARRIGEGDRFVRSGAWARQGALGPEDFMGRDLANGLFLVVGAGRIGFATALRARAFGMQIGYVARSRHLEFEMAPLTGVRMTLDDGLKRADVVSVHCPLTDATRGMIGRDELARMRPEAVLVNTARGPVVDESALAEALAERRIFAAGLDVFEREPEVNARLRELENVVMTPHMGSAEARWRREMTRIVTENVTAVLAGREPPNRVV